MESPHNSQNHTVFVFVSVFVLCECVCVCVFVCEGLMSRTCALFSLMKKYNLAYC